MTNPLHLLVYSVINGLDSQICITVFLTVVCCLVLKITALRICFAQNQQFLEDYRGCLELHKNIHYILKGFFQMCMSHDTF